MDVFKYLLCWPYFEEDEERERAKKDGNRTKRREKRDDLKVDLSGAGNRDNLGMTSRRKYLPGHEKYIKRPKTCPFYSMTPKSVISKNKLS